MHQIIIVIIIAIFVIVFSIYAFYLYKPYVEYSQEIFEKMKIIENFDKLLYGFSARIEIPYRAKIIIDKLIALSNSTVFEIEFTKSIIYGNVSNCTWIRDWLCYSNNGILLNLRPKIENNTLRIWIFKKVHGYLMTVIQSYQVLSVKYGNDVYNVKKLIISY